VKQKFNTLLLIVSLFAGLVSLTFHNLCFAQNIESQVDAYIGAHMRCDYFSGNVLIARDDQVLINKSYGMANYEHDVPNAPHTKFQIGSMSKPFTAMAIMILQETGLLSVNDPLSKFIPDFPDGDKITIHHLLTHTSGVPALASIPDFEKTIKIKTPLKDTIEKLKKMPMLFVSGDEYQYSNSGYLLLGDIIEKTSGKSYGEFLKENIFDPLDMKNTGLDDPITIVKHRAEGYTPDGGNKLRNADYEDLTSIRGPASLYSTVEDLYRWDRALYTEKLVKKSALKGIFTPPTDRHYGYGWVISKQFDHKMIWHDGSTLGFQTYMCRFVDDNACLIILSNFANAPMAKIRKDLAAILFGEEYELPEIREIARVDPAIYDTYVGKYELENEDVITVIKENDRLFAETLSFPTRFEIFPESETKFFLKIREGVAMTFVKDGNGEVKEFILHWGEIDVPGRRIE
jgi:CubicO group peptidase (beta-lactamase class C family)